MDEKIIIKIMGFFQTNEFFQTFYEVIFTNKRLLLIKSGETFRAFFARADVAHNNRKKIKNMSLDKILNEFQVDSIFLEEIDEITIKNKTFINNTSLIIKCETKKIVFYSTNTYDLNKYNEVFKKENLSLIYKIA